MAFEDFIKDNIHGKHLSGPSIKKFKSIIDRRKKIQDLMNEMDKKTRTENDYINLLMETAQLNHELFTEYMTLNMIMKDKVIENMPIPVEILENAMLGTAIKPFYDDAEKRDVANLYAPMKRIHEFLEKLKAGEKYDSLKI